MRIAILAHIRHPIAQPFMGGMEAHAYHLAHALQGRGHDVTLFASGDSRVDVALVSVTPEHYERTYPFERYHGSDQLNEFLDAAFAKTLPDLRDGEFDVIHNNSLHRFPPRMSYEQRIPMVTSLHVPAFDWLRRAVLESAAPWCRFTATSRRHALSYWSDATTGALPDGAHVVHNGIDLSAWSFAPQGNGRAIWAGRIHPNKGPHLAAEAARRAGVALDLYGPIEIREYFDQRLRPLLSESIRYRGHVSGERLAARMREASVYVFTPMWDEPFGLVAVEAMACGLPVAAFDNGAAREVVGSAGIIAPAGDVDALAEAIRRALAIPRLVPRARVEESFSVDGMVAGYEAVYEAAITGRSYSGELSADLPQAVPQTAALRLAA